MIKMMNDDNQTLISVQPTASHAWLIRPDGFYELRLASFACLMLYTSKGGGRRIGMEAKPQVVWGTKSPRS